MKLQQGIKKSLNSEVNARETYAGFFIERSLIRTGNPDVVSAAKQRYADGSFVVELKLKESAFHQDIVALRSTEKPAEEQELLAFAERLRRCRIR
ncbi:MAG: hypothetical protein BGP24_15485 [Lysobacterales bacterium 69-70]|nr:hypothetical protein [Xanthomonadaceae bacterium]ODU35560.1 MAG: hypothetical protein ABS97_04060 [Xanthomonadaceae bacterium SCN 69-320]ODV22982.1 MAG: hypothetical protein ABT27_00555 [Xanthomonadaceae bacterium SCN 69-25]OJY96705.1 MAG: hypothetical protein BGP24_15485 [Xanthomonadales bacterium 69-70]